MSPGRLPGPQCHHSRAPCFNIHASPIISVSLPAVLEGVFFAQEQCLIANKLTKDLYLFYSLLIISIKLLDMRDVHNKWN